MIVDKSPSHKYSPEKRSKSPEIRIHKQRNDDVNRNLRLSKDKTPVRELSSPRTSKTPERTKSSLIVNKSPSHKYSPEKRSKSPEIRIHKQRNDDVNRNLRLSKDKTPVRELSSPRTSKTPERTKSSLIVNKSPSDKYSPEKRSKSPEIRIHKQRNDDVNRNLRLSKDKSPVRELSSPRRNKTPEIITQKVSID